MMDRDCWLCLVGIGICIGLYILSFVYASDACKAKGGHFRTFSGSTIGFAGKNMAVGTSSTSVCLTPDGRIIE